MVRPAYLRLIHMWIASAYRICLLTVLILMPLPHILAFLDNYAGSIDIANGFVMAGDYLALAGLLLGLALAALSFCKIPSSRLPLFAGQFIFVLDLLIQPSFGTA